MSLLDKDGASFDQLVRDQKAISALSMIMATYYIPGETPKKERKNQIARRLIDAYRLFRPDKKVANDLYNGAGTYGQIDKKTKAISTTLSDEEVKNAFESQYTLGLELGIWKNSDLELCDVALKVAKMEITITEYVDIVFQNLFSYQMKKDKNGTYKSKYVHFLFDTLDNLDSQFKITKDKLKEIFFPTNSGNDNRNALFNYLKDTSYFEAQGDTLYLVPTWQERLAELKSSCNLEYKHKDVAETQAFFKNKDNYARYVTSQKIQTAILANTNQKNDIDAFDHQSQANNLFGKNIIYYGAPGTGKSYGVSEEIKEVYPNFNDEGSDDSSFVFRTTFHPEYTYTDFVGQVMPQVKEGVVKYEFSPGIFTKALAKAMNPKQEGRPVFLVLEELSRANVAAVFGDLFQLLDRHNGRSEYSITNSLIAKEVYGDSGADRKIYIPNNLHIYGTVNTNDQNVFVMDTAFKRRFEWKYVSTRPVSDENNPLIKIKGLEGNDSDVDWHKFYQRLNKFITTDMALGEDKQVGQFFIKFTDNDEENRNQLQNKLLQYLWDDVQGASFNGVKLFDPSISTFSELYDKFGQNQKVFSDDFLKKLFPYKRTVEEVSSDEV